MSLSPNSNAKAPESEEDWYASENLHNAEEWQNFPQEQYSTEVNFGDEENVKENDNSSPKVELQYCCVSRKFEGTSFCDLVNEQQNLSMPSIKVSSTDGQDITQKSYNPRRVSFSPNATTRHEDQQPKETLLDQNFEKGENPVDPTQIEINGSDLLKESKLLSTKNYILDYSSLRKSGYFLSGQKRSSTPILMASRTSRSLNFEIISKASQVESWLSCLPEDSAHLRDPDDDLMGEQDFQKYSNTSVPIASKFTSEEENLKRLLLDHGDLMAYTSEQTPVLTYDELDSILEFVNEKISAFLEKYHKAPENVRYKYSYVSGKVEIPSFLKVNCTPKTSTAPPCRDSWFERQVWVPSFFKKQQRSADPSAEAYIDKTRCSVILEPYHGPLAVNGALIESGSASFVLAKGFLGTVVEEVKAALQAINEALRSIQFGSTTKSHEMQFPQVHFKEEDPEIQRLTEALQKRKFGEKTTFRTVFGLKNAEKIPSYSLLFPRRRRIQHPRRGGFFRAVNGWIQRKARNEHGRSNRRRYRIMNNASQGNSMPAAPNTQQRTDGQTHDFGGVFSNIVSTIVSLVPFPLTPGIPAQPSSLDEHNDNETPAPEQSRRAQTPSRQELRLSVPTRYQILSRANMNTKSYNKVKKIHAGST